MEFKKICDLQAGNRVDGFYLIKSVLCRVSSNNKKYYDFTFADKTGEINAKLWDAEENEDNIYIENKLVKVRAAVVQWQNSLQLKIDKIRLVTDEDNVVMSEFVPSAPYEGEEMYIEMLQYVDKIENEHIKNIVNYIIDKIGDKLINFPAAKKIITL